MFKIIFSHDVDITPKEALALREKGKRAGAGAGGLEIGIEPCAIITVGFIWPCGEMRIGGCGTILDKATANVARMVAGKDAPRVVKLDPEKDIETIQEMIVFEVKKSDKED
jgi:hypothetical protein